MSKKRKLPRFNKNGSYYYRDIAGKSLPKPSPKTLDKLNAIKFEESAGGLTNLDDLGGSK